MLFFKIILLRFSIFIKIIDIFINFHFKFNIIRFSQAVSILVFFLILLWWVFNTTEKQWSFVLKFILIKFFINYRLRLYSNFRIFQTRFLRLSYVFYQVRLHWNKLASFCLTFSGWKILFLSKNTISVIVIENFSDNWFVFS